MHHLEEAGIPRWRVRCPYALLCLCPKSRAFNRAKGRYEFSLGGKVVGGAPLRAGLPVCNPTKAPLFQEVVVASCVLHWSAW